MCAATAVREVPIEVAAPAVIMASTAYFAGHLAAACMPGMIAVDTALHPMAAVAISGPSNRRGVSWVAVSKCRPPDMRTVAVRPMRAVVTWTVSLRHLFFPPVEEWVSPVPGSLVLAAWYSDMVL